MLKISADEIHFIIYQYLHESGFEHSSFVFAQEANMHENRFNEYRIPSGMLIVFLEKALTLIHMETHLDDNEEIKECKQPYTLLSPHTCDVTVEQTQRAGHDSNMRTNLANDDKQFANNAQVAGANASNLPRDGQVQNFNPGQQVQHSMAAAFESQQMAARHGLVVDQSMGVNPGQADSMLPHQLAMVQNQHPFDQNNLQQQQQHHAAYMQQQRAQQYLHQANQQLGMQHGFTDQFMPQDANNFLHAQQMQQLRQSQQANQAASGMGAGQGQQPVGAQHSQQMTQHHKLSMMNQLTGADPSQQAHLMQQQQHRMMAAQMSMLTQGMHPNGDMALHDQNLIKDQKIEPLEHNAELGVFLRQTQQDGDSRDIYFAQFNPKHRFLATAGAGFTARLFDLRRDDFSDFKHIEIPHVKRAEPDNQETDVSSIDWNTKGDKLITSSSDMVARVCSVDLEGNVEIANVKVFNEYLMQSKFCTESDNLVATGGLMSQIYVWDCETSDCREVACFDHKDLDADFKGLEIEWQNAKNIAVAGKSKFIYLWSIDQPNHPLIKWDGHQEIVEQIQWDPNKRLLASCSNDSFVCIWSPEKTDPELRLDTKGSAVLTIKWSHNMSGTPSDGAMLAAGCQDGQILIFSVSTAQLCVKLDAQDREGGLRTMAFSPDNSMLASGGVDSLIIWSLQGQGSIIKHFQRQNGSQQHANGTNYGMVGMAPGSGQSGNPVEEQYAQRTMVQELNWSNDAVLLGAAIQDYVAVFDISKILQRASQLVGLPPQGNTAQMGQQL